MSFSGTINACKIFNFTSTSWPKIANRIKRPAKNRIEKVPSFQQIFMNNCLFRFRLLIYRISVSQSQRRPHRHEHMIPRWVCLCSITCSMLRKALTRRRTLNSLAFPTKLNEWLNTVIINKSLYNLPPALAPSPVVCICNYSGTLRAYIVWWLIALRCILWWLLLCWTEKGLVKWRV